MAKRPAPPENTKPRRPVEKAPGSGEPPPTPAQDPVKLWGRKTRSADAIYKKWAEEFDVRHLDQYYRGKQWKGLAEEEAKKKYVINMVFATVETQLPSLLFSRPKVQVDPTPSKVMDASSDVSNRSTVIEQTLQTLVDKRDLHFGFITTLALHEAYSRFGVVEVGYSADYIDNPNAEKPILKDDQTPMTDSAGQEVKEPKQTLKSESVYLRRIPAKAFRAFPGRNLLEENDWVGYYEWVYVSDVKANPNFTNTDTLKGTGRIVSTNDGEDDLRDQADRDPREARDEEMVKIWKIWDLRAKQRIVLAEGHDKLLLDGKAFTFLPFADMKFFELEDEYYPLPPIFNWLSPQDEINESREMAKVHRRRALRRYMREPSVLKTEFEKLESGEDMVCIEVPKVDPSPIKPIEDAPLSPQFWTQLAASKDDLNQITGVGGEARGTPESDTATQANIINVREQVRESRARAQVADWLGRICRLMLLTMREKMQLSLMVRRSVDPFRPGPSAVAKDAQAWYEVKKEQIDDLDIDIKIDIASLSPIAEASQRDAWNVVLGLLTNQPLLMILMTASPDAPDEPSPLLRKTLMLNGIKNDAEIREIWRVGQVVMQQMAMMAMATAAAKGGPMPGGFGAMPGGGGMPGTAPSAGTPAGQPAAAATGAAGAV